MLNIHAYFNFPSAHERLSYMSQSLYFCKWEKIKSVIFLILSYVEISGSYVNACSGYSSNRQTSSKTNMLTGGTLCACWCLKAMSDLSKPYQSFVPPL